MKRTYKFKPLLCYIVIGFSWTSTFLYTPTLSTYAASLGATASMIGAITGGFGLMQILFRAPAGMLRDCFGKSRGIIAVGMTAAFLAPLGMLLFPTPKGLLLFRAISGINAAVWPVLTAYVAEQYAPSQTAKAISICNAVNALGNIFGMLLGGWLVEQISQRAAFWGASIFGLLALILTFWIPDVKSTTVSRISFRSLFRMLCHKRLMFLALMVTVFQIIITGTSMTFTPVLAHSLGASAKILGVLSMLSMVGMLIASTISVSYVRWMGGVRNAIGGALLLLALTTAAIGLCRTLTFLYILQLFQGISGYMVIVILMGDSLLPYDNDQRGTAGGMFQSVFAIGMFVGPILSGVIYEKSSLDRMYLVLAAISAAAGISMFALYEKLDAKQRIEFKSK